MKTKSKVTAASIASFATTSGTAAAFSGWGAWCTKHVIELGAYLYYAPTNRVAQYFTVKAATRASTSFMMIPAVTTITNVAFGALIAIAIIFSGVGVYNLFFASSKEEKISLCSATKKTVKAFIPIFE